MMCLIEHKIIEMNERRMEYFIIRKCNHWDEVDVVALKSPNVYGED